MYNYLKKKRVTENDIEVFIEILSEYGFDIEETYDYKGNNSTRYCNNNHW